MIHEHPAKSTRSELNTNSPKKCLKYNLPHIINDTPAIVVESNTHSTRFHNAIHVQYTIVIRVINIIMDLFNGWKPYVLGLHFFLQ